LKKWRCGREIAGENFGKRAKKKTWEENFGRDSGRKKTWEKNLRK
jgi:hypothetical protein